ncbi:hypothetical protein GCM10010124_17880 [Pilimelia terevasa]|uniref:SCP domain-containing protein n=1 Tax=Pilimelia terevasa TaxID=53372 RepID=A0A8J3BQA6_9ACTN|nr:CAP domain-containing protein [Pilimelia terevasa]GGK25741.1 hypothetical protein GCM10010124_17880 [Pilimelia terevasa]
MSILRRLAPLLVAAAGVGFLAVPATPAAPAAATTSVAAARAARAATYSAEAMRYTNAYRVRSGCRAVRPLASLNIAARRHSADMAAYRYFNHVSPRTGTFVQRARRAGYQYAMSENIAFGYGNGRSVFVGWANSAGHRANMLNCAARSVGVGMAYASNGTPYWTQVFGRS